MNLDLIRQIAEPGEERRAKSFTLSSRLSLLLAVFALCSLLFATFTLASTFYLDPELGNDANNGTTWDLAWKTITSGATAARIAPGDIIKIKKSPDPASIGNVTFTDGNATLTLATAQTKTADRGEAAWTCSTDVTCSTTTTKQEGTYAASFAFAANFTTGKAAYKTLGSAQNFSTYSKITFWIYTSSIIPANTLRIDLTSDTGGDTVVDSFTIPITLQASVWYPFTIARNGGGSLGATINAIRLHCLLDPSTPTIYLDNFEACNDFSLQSLIGKNISGEVFWPIRSIVETTVILGRINNNIYYRGTGETVTSYRRETFKTTPGTNDGTINDSGTFGNPITFSGGWDRTSGLQNGESWFSGQNETVYGINSSSKNYLKFEKLYFIKYSQGVYINSAIGIEVDGVGGSACSLWGVLFNFTDNAVYGNLKNIIAVGNMSGISIDEATKSTHIKVEGVKTFSNAGDAFRAGYNGLGSIEVKDIDSFGNTGYGMRIYCPLYAVNPHTRNNSSGAVGLSYAYVRHFYNTNFEEATKIVQYSYDYIGNYPFSYYDIQKYQGVAGDHRRYYQYGYIKRDTAEARGGSGECMQLAPSHASAKLTTDLSPVPAAASVQKTVTVYLKKSATYNGNNPRIGLRFNGWIVAGMNNCAVTTDYQQFSINYTPSEDGVLELVIDADGTAGSIYADDVGYDSVTDTLSQWQNGVPVLTQPAGGGGGGGGSVWGTIR